MKILKSWISGCQIPLKKNENSTEIQKAQQAPTPNNKQVIFLVTMVAAEKVFLFC